MTFFYDKKSKGFCDWIELMDFYCFINSVQHLALGVQSVPLDAIQRLSLRTIYQGKQNSINSL